LPEVIHLHESSALRYVLPVPRRRRYAWALALVALAASLAACGSSSTPAAKPSSFPRPTGRLVDRSVAASLAGELSPLDVPRWATPPIDAAAARIARTQGSRQVVVIPYRSGPGWCLGLVDDGHSSFGWCTRRTGSRMAIEGGLTFFTQRSVGFLGRVSASVARVVVVRADGRHVSIPLRHGVALGAIGDTALVGDRPVAVEALGPDGAQLARRSFGSTAAAWRNANPTRPPPSPTSKQMLAALRHAHAPCVGAPDQSNGAVYTDIASTRPTPLLTDFLPTFVGGLGGSLYLTAAHPVRVTLVDGDGAHRAVPLGAGQCAYLMLSSRDRRAPFRLEVRNATGRVVQVVRPDDWPGFPTDDS
jgi:hypothetical protein